MLVALAVSLVGLLLDPRMITGAPAWLKPFKFAISITLYSFTLLWMLSFVQGRRFLVNMVSLVTLLAFVVEMIIVVTQVLRATISHFNAASAFEGHCSRSTGGFVAAIWTMNFVAAVLCYSSAYPTPRSPGRTAGLATHTGRRRTGVLMTQPTPAQRAATTPTSRYRSSAP